MKALIQKVKSASVAVDGKIVSQIGPGLCVLIGISRDDGPADLKWISNKILSLCFFDDEAREPPKRWSSSVKTAGLEVLCVSQFTLYATLKGNKLDFHKSLEASKSQEMYNQLLKMLGDEYQAEKIKDGVFGAMMEVNIVNDGPVTLQIECRNGQKVSE